MIELLEKNDGTKVMVDACIKLVSSTEKVIVFGAGVGGTILYNLLDENSLAYKICCYSDNNSLKHNTYFKDKLILSPTKLMEEYPGAKIIVASSAFPEIYKQLIEYGFDKNDINLYNFAFSELDYTDKEFIYDHLEDFERAYNYMSDHKSKNVYLNILNYKITKNNEWLDKLYNFVDDEKNQYFDSELIDLTKVGYIADVGSYIGDTFEQAENLGIPYKKYYCFEADPHVYKILEENVRGKENVIPLNIGLWDKKGRLNFSNLNPGSTTITDEDISNEYIEVDSLDNILQNEAVDFLKLDIEGAEFEALKGMENIIKEKLPIITFAVYHKRDDYFKLLDLIDSFAPSKYSFYFRQYRYTPTETICYAIPK